MSNSTWNMTPAEIASLQQRMDELHERERAVAALAQQPCTSPTGHRMRVTSYRATEDRCVHCGLTAEQIDGRRDYEYGDA